jgi:hypothetical protein
MLGSDEPVVTRVAVAVASWPTARVG